MDEKGHAEEEKQIHNREIEYKNVWYRLFSLAFGLFKDGVDYNRISSDAQNTYGSKNTGKDGISILDSHGH